MGARLDKGSGIITLKPLSLLEKKKAAKKFREIIFFRSFVRSSLLLFIPLSVAFTRGSMASSDMRVYETAEKNETRRLVLLFPSGCRLCERKIIKEKKSGRIQLHRSRAQFGSLSFLV